MIKDTQNKKIGACRAIMGLVFLSVLIFGLFLTFPVKTANAANNYIDNIVFYQESGQLIAEFHVKTTFTLSQYLLISINGGYTTYNTSPCSFLTNTNPEPTGCTLSNNRYSHCTFTAGITYKLKLAGVSKYPDTNKCYTLAYYTAQFGYPIVSHYIQFDYTPINDAQKYYFTEMPTLTITYPQNNYEIAESFDIQGSYTLPAGSGYNILMAGFFKAGFYDINWNNAVNVFSIPVSEPSGSFDNLRVGNYLPKDIYDIYFRVYGGGLAYEFPFHISNINIVSDLPYELPITGEVSPDIPVFSSLSAQTIYANYSNYATSTALFNTITGAIEPLIITIGDNLTFFSSQFNQASAKEAGQKAGGAVLVIRANAGIINSFFNDLPIAEILFLYLSALVVVIVFRIIRLLLKLIPFT